MVFKETDDQYVAHTYGRFPLEIVSGKGSVLKDVDGKEYIDLGSGIAVDSFGVADDQWIAAVNEQMCKIQHISNLYYTQPCAELAKMLCEKTGMKKVFFGNSGAEANECAIKVARKYAADRKGPEYFTIITLEKSFHGRTLTTLAATGQDQFHKLFQPLTPGFVHTPANDLEAFIALAEKVKPAGVMMECIQGEGGVRALDEDFVKGVADYAEKNDIMVIIDEVQSGNGRSGMFYSYMNYGIRPNIVSTAKGLGGGLPIGACLMDEKTKDVLGPSDHGSTFGGNPVCCAGAISIVSRIDDALMADVKRKGDIIRDILKDAEGVEYVSGMGLMVGVKTVKPAIEVVKGCMEKGVICLTAHELVRLLPALNIPDDLLIKAVNVIKEVCKQ